MEYTDIENAGIKLFKMNPVIPEERNNSKIILATVGYDPLKQ